MWGSTVCIHVLTEELGALSKSIMPDTGHLLFCSSSPLLLMRDRLTGTLAEGRQEGFQSSKDPSGGKVLRATNEG